MRPDLRQQMLEAIENVSWVENLIKPALEKNTQEHDSEPKIPPLHI
jgi:hypothetical protein